MKTPSSHQLSVCRRSHVLALPYKFSKPSRLLKKFLATTVVITSLLAVHDLQATNYYWDSNSSVAGAGLDPSGYWGTSAFWTTSTAGTAATSLYTTTLADSLRFSAGSDTTGAYTVGLNGSTQNALQVLAYTGNLILSNGTVTLAQTGSGTGLGTNGTANMEVSSNATIQVTNSTAASFLIFAPVVGTSISINGTVTASSATNSTYIQLKTGTGTVNVNSNLGSNATLKSALQLGGIQGGLGTLNLNGNQTLGTTKISVSDSTRIGAINLGSTVNTGNAVQVGQIDMYSVAGNMTGSVINVNSAATITGLTLRAGAALSVAGSLTNTGGSVLGLITDTTHGATMKILNGGTASLTTINVVDGSVFTNAGTLTGTTLTLGEATGNTSGKFVMGDATGGGTTTLTQITTLGTGTANAIVGGNAAASTLTLNLSANATYSGKLGGAGANENNLAFVKQSSAALTLAGLNTYTGNTTVSAGTLLLADNASLNFLIGANGTNNGIGGGGTINLNGDFTFDLTGAAATGSWNIVNVASLTETFGTTFTVASGFAETFVGSNIWTKAVGPSTYTFTEANGLLTAIPEPATWGLLAFSLTTVLVLRRRKMA